MRALSRDMVSSVEDNFEAEGRPKKWKKLKASTIKQRKKQGTWPGRMLQRSAGGLANTITSSSTNTEATVGSNKPYAPYLQSGTKKMVARPFLNFTQSDVKDFEDTITNHLTRGAA